MSESYRQRGRVIRKRVVRKPVASPLGVLNPSLLLTDPTLPSQVKKCEFFGANFDKAVVQLKDGTRVGGAWEYAALLSQARLSQNICVSYRRWEDMFRRPTAARCCCFHASCNQQISPFMIRLSMIYSSSASSRALLLRGKRSASLFARSGASGLS